MSSLLAPQTTVLHKSGFIVYRDAPEPPASQPVPLAAAVQPQVSTDQYAPQQRRQWTNYSMTEPAVQSHHRALNQVQHVQTQLIYITTVMYMSQEPVHLPRLHDLEPQSFQCSHCNMLHFKDKTVQSDECYFFYCLNDFIKLSFSHSMSFYLKDLFTTETSEIKHFQQ